ncbi:MAG: hypothetical protein GX442_21175 [Candidatus Riflebacteria bacterium]|nr:hypothetical protein [Candidatus Riflebacteria bacterium]
MHHRDVRSARLAVLVFLLLAAGIGSGFGEPEARLVPGTEEAARDAEQALVQSWLDDPAALERLTGAAPALDPRFRQRLAVRLRFSAMHQPAAGLRAPLEALGTAARTGAIRGGPLTTANMLKIPLRTGRLEVTWLFKKYRGEILVCTPQQFSAVLDQYSIDVVPDPAHPGKVLAKLMGDPQAPASPVRATITSDGTTAQIVAEDGTTVTVVHVGKGVYKFSSSKLPVTLTGRFIG